MDDVTMTKLGFTAIFATLSAILGVLYIPVLLMVLCNGIDFITGIWASMKKGENLQSKKILWGIAKKVCMWLLVVIGAVVDQLLSYSSEAAGITLPFELLVACIVAIWIICSEIVSILENMIVIEVSLPPFLMPLVRMIQKKAEEAVNTSELEKEK